MILVDTSYWIELLRARSRHRIEPEKLLTFVTCPPIVQELFQGLRSSPSAEALRDNILALRCVANPVPLELYITAADIFRDGRKLGFTVRSSVDCLIAAIAIRHSLTVLHKDRDFSTIARFTELKEAQTLAK